MAWGSREKSGKQELRKYSHDGDFFDQYNKERYKIKPGINRKMMLFGN